MHFTYESYRELLRKLREKGYRFRRYDNWQGEGQTVILRHDVDNSLEKAALMSELEGEVCPEGAEATYFVLVSTDFYNVHSKASRECMRSILDNGGHIGLHFDETQYPLANVRDMAEYVLAEAETLSCLTGQKVAAVSMHRPSQAFLSANLTFDGIINAYSETYFKEMKYLSDSRRHWREDVDGIVEAAQHPRLHLLTHPFWYREGAEKNLRESLRDAILAASLAYYDHLDENFRDLGAEITRAEVESAIFR